MDPEVKNLLEENLKLSKENNELLLKIRSIQRWAQITRLMYWFVIIGISFGAFYYLKPYLGNVLNIYTGGVSNAGNVGSLTKNLKDSKSEVRDLLKELND
jgi:hypothetical protein